MRYIADLHVHSKYSRATARNLDLEHLYIFAQLKGIQVVATGDYTHPAWFAELSEKLVPAEAGFFRLDDRIAAACDREVPPACRCPVRFVLSTEISNIYKKNGVTRKNHNLVLMPGLEEAARFNTRLDAIGNIQADGRPILGLDARDLLEIALETSDAAYLIPAHIWTPWFSVFGSKSGFDSLSECFEDLTGHIFALETGLSSDPPMNWRVSGIDGLTLVSNSDAHSPAKLGREACLFDTELSYAAMRSALETGDPRHYLGTFEFYPEEGKYHYDGHRKCGVCSHPAETINSGGVCPVCGQPLTLGVLYRVEQLADRPPGEKPARCHPYHSIIPLEEVLSEIIGVGPKTKKVAAAYQRILDQFGSEFEVLYSVPIEELKRGEPALLDEAIGRMRRGRVHLEPGYDGEYGHIRVFDKEERAQLQGQRTLFPLTEAPPARPSSAVSPDPAAGEAADSSPADTDPGKSAKATGADPGHEIDAGLNAPQRRAVAHGPGPLMIMAGPGSGKTRTITCRMARLLREGQADKRSVAAITFTNRAAGEMKERLADMLGGAADLPQVSTFHAFCLGLLTEENQSPRVILDEADQLRLITGIVRGISADGEAPDPSPNRVRDLIGRLKQNLLGPDADPAPLLRRLGEEIDAGQLAAVYRDYQAALARDNACDYEDLIMRVVQRLETDQERRDALRRRYAWIFVDEFQDVNYGQYRLVRLLAPADGNVCVIGDPDQAIYGFRGSDAAFFRQFAQDFPGVTRISLEQNYRSTDTILTAAYHVISRQGDDNQRIRVYSGRSGVPTIAVAGLASDKAEAVYTGKTIEKMVGGLGFHSVDFGAAGYDDGDGALSFADIAVLFRTRQQAAVYADVLAGAGIPCHRVSRESLFDSPGVAELLSWLRLCEANASFPDFERAAAAAVPPVRSRTLAALEAWSRRHDFSVETMLTALPRYPVDKVDIPVQRVLANLAETVLDLREDMAWMRLREKIAYLREARPELNNLISADPAREEALEQVLARAEETGGESGDFFARAALAADADSFTPRADRVRLMTIHAAKGLEFPVVFVAGCEDGLLPLQRPGRNDDVDPAEERRLFYVAMTRAGSRLIFTWARKRLIYGRLEERQLSPFVADIEARLLRREEGPAKRSRGGQGAVQLELF